MMYPQPPLSDRYKIGDLVRTVKDAHHSDWTPQARIHVKWGALGRVHAVHDGHGLSYEIEHEDGTIAGYVHEELKLKEIGEKE